MSRESEFEQLKSHYDAIVIGGGPAGSISAALLARKGFSVLLVDQNHFPRTKVCGACLSGKGVNALQSFGFEPVLNGSISTRYFCLASKGKQAVLPVSGGLVISRRTLDQRLIDKARSTGVEVLEGVRGEVQACHESLRMVNLKNGLKSFRLSCNVVLQCAGLGRGLSINTSEDEMIGDYEMIGLTTHLAPIPEYPASGLWMAVSKCGYVGITQQEDDLLNVSAAIARNELTNSKSPSSVVGRIIDEAGLDVPTELENATWIGTKALTRRLVTPACERMFFVGDAAGYVEPFTGEGITWAIETAAKATGFAEQAINHWDTSLISQWSHFVRQHAQARQRCCRILRFGLRRPRLVSAAIHLLALCPSASWPILRSIHGDLSVNRTARHVS